MPNFGCLAASLAHVWVLLRDPFDGPQGIVKRSFDPLHVSIHIGTLGTEFNRQTISQNITIKHYGTLVQVRLVSERLGLSWTFDLQAIQNFI